MDAEVLRELALEGLYLAEPHGQLIWEGKKKSIERPDEQSLCGHYILCSGKYAYGVVSIGDSTLVAAKDFDALFPSHRITTKEHQKWWPDTEHLCSHEIIGFDGCEKPVPVVIPNGVRMLMGKVQFKDMDIELGGEDMPYSSMSDVNPALKGIDPPITLAQANLIARWADKIEEAGGADNPWAAAIGQFKRLYRVEGGKWVKRNKALEEAVSAVSEGDVIIVKGAVDVESSLLSVTDPPAQSQVEVEADAEPTETEDKSIEKLVADAIAEELPVVEDVQPIKSEMTEMKAEDEAADKEPARCKCPKCGGTTTAESGESCSDLEYSDCEIALVEVSKKVVGKAQKVLRPSQKEQTIKSIARLFIDGLKQAVVGSAEVKAAALTQAQPVVLIKSLSGETLLITRTTNAFKDREKEIFTTQSLHDLVESKKDDVIKGVLRYKHMLGTDFADTIYMGVAGRFLIEAHKFHNTPLAQAFKEVFEKYPTGHPVVSPEGWGVSHGFKFGQGDKNGRIYKRFDKIETSVLPAHLAANPYTNVEVVTVDEKSREGLATLIGEEVAASTIAGAESETERLEKAGVEHKEIKAETLLETPKEAPKEPEQDVVKAVGETYHLGELAEVFKQLTADLKEIKGRLDLIEKTDEEKLEQKAKETPRFNAPWSAYRASQADETVLGKKERVMDAGKSIKSIAEEMVQHITGGA